MPYSGIKIAVVESGSTCAYDSLRRLGNIDVHRFERAEDLAPESFDLVVADFDTCDYRALVDRVGGNLPIIAVSAHDPKESIERSPNVLCFVTKCENACGFSPTIRFFVDRMLAERRDRARTLSLLDRLKQVVDRYEVKCGNL